MSVRKHSWLEHLVRAKVNRKNVVALTDDIRLPLPDFVWPHAAREARGAAAFQWSLNGPQRQASLPF